MKSTSWSRWFEQLCKAPRAKDSCVSSEVEVDYLQLCVEASETRAKNSCVSSEVEVDYLQLCVEASERVQKLTSPKHSSSLHLNGAQCRLLADAVSEAVGSAKQETHGMDDASVPLFGPALRELCRVVGDCEKLVRDCCNTNWLAVAILLADSKEDFLLRVSELKWCARAWLTIVQHGLQGGTWLEQFHKSSKMSVGDRRVDSDEDSMRFKCAAVEDLRELRAKLVEVRGASREKQVRELARYVLRRCEMLGARPDGEQIPWRSEYELWKSGAEVILPRQPIGAGGFGEVWRGSWFGEAFAFKSFGLVNGMSWREVANMIKTGSHPRTIRLLGLHRSTSKDSIVMELMPSDLDIYIKESIRRRLRRADSRFSIGDHPFALHVALDIMLQVAEGTEVLHKLKLFHRDLKSNNVLVQPVEMLALREEGYVRVKLADFGLSGPRSDPFSNRVGTQAPEMDAGSVEKVVYGAKADAYSFSCLCYEVLSGKGPFDEIERFSALEEYLEGGGRPELPANLPSQIASLVRRCWDEEPTKRPSFTSICKELRYLKFLITIGGETQFRALDVPDEDAKSIATIVKDLPWIEHGKLRFIRHIGSGGYGSVDECEVQGKGRVAVKNLLRCSSKVRVEEEAALLVRVQHRNVVKLVACAFNKEERRGMIVMELMDQDLHNLILKLREGSPNAPPFPLPVALGMMLEVATAMKHIRSCNVLHRDLKTTNILVNVKERMLQSSSWALKMGIQQCRPERRLKTACTDDARLRQYFSSACEGTDPDSPLAERTGTSVCQHGYQSQGANVTVLRFPPRTAASRPPGMSTHSLTISSLGGMSVVSPAQMSPSSLSTFSPGGVSNDLPARMPTSSLSTFSPASVTHRTAVQISPRVQVVESSNEESCTEHLPPTIYRPARSRSSLAHTWKGVVWSQFNGFAPATAHRSECCHYRNPGAPAVRNWKYRYGTAATALPYGRYPMMLMYPVVAGSR